jgi:hypothetical protein
VTHSHTHTHLSVPIDRASEQLLAKACAEGLGRHPGGCLGTGALGGKPGSQGGQQWAQHAAQVVPRAPATALSPNTAVHKEGVVPAPAPAPCPSGGGGGCFLAQEGEA